MHRRPIHSVLIPTFCAWALLLAGPVIAAPPTVPASLPYRGLLLDGLGQPRTGSVDLTVRVFDAVVGGTLVYKQSFPAVSLADGVFSVQLGPNGEASDAPANPLTNDLAIALGGDAGATSPVRFLEVMVGSDGALSRTQILSSAYALRATSAATADTAATALTANDVANVGGVDASFVTQTPPPTNITPTSFNVQVGPQPAGFVNVAVTNANGQAHTATSPFEFLTSLAHTITLAANRTTFDVRPGTLEVILGGSGSLLHLLLDKNDDGDFADAGEDQTLSSSAGSDAALALNGAGNALIATQTKIVVGVTD